MPKRMTQTVKKKITRKHSLNSKPKSKKRNCRANPKAEWASQNRPSEFSTKNSKWCSKKSPRARRLSSSLNP